MPSFQTKRPVPYGPQAMTELVADVENYPQFLPLCDSLKVVSRSTADSGIETIVARMGVGYGPIQESFTSRIVIDRARHQIDVTHLDGPFRKLDNSWHFAPTRSGCDVEFSISYEFRSLALQVLLGSMFDRAFRKFAEAFEARAKVLYGVPKNQPAAELPTSDTRQALRLPN
jgi:coenzyme Q-binding protein COQ10